jgi:hypothetical protein
MDKLNNSEDVQRFLHEMTIRVDEEVVCQVVNALRGKGHRSYYSLHTKRKDKEEPILSKKTADKIKKLYKQGKLKPYEDYLDGSTDIDSVPTHPNLEIDVVKTWVNPVPMDSQTYNTAVFVSVNFRPSRPMQLAKITLECEEGLLDLFAASPSLPILLERNETHEIEFRLPLGVNGLPQKHNNFAAGWYIREQLRIGHNQPRSEGRLRITADAKEWISAPFLIPTTVAEPIKYTPGRPSILTRFRAEQIKEVEHEEEDILKLEVQKCTLGSPVPPEMISSEHTFGVEYTEYIIVIVDYNSSSTTVPLQVAKRQLCLLNDPGIDPTEPSETRILDKEETHTLTYKVKGSSLLRTQKGESPSTYWGRLFFTLGGGKLVSSVEFQIPTPKENLQNELSQKNEIRQVVKEKDGHLHENDLERDKPLKEIVVEAQKQHLEKVRTQLIALSKNFKEIDLKLNNHYTDYIPINEDIRSHLTDNSFWQNVDSFKASDGIFKTIYDEF